MNSFHDGDVYPVDVSTQPRLVTQASSRIPITLQHITLVMLNQDVYLSDIIYTSQYDPTSLQYMLEFFRHVAQTIPQPSDESSLQSTQDAQTPSTMPIEPMPGNARDMLQDRAGIIVLREDLDFYAIPPRREIEQTEMIEVKRAAGKALLQQDGIFSGLRKSEEPGTTEQHLIEMLTAGYALHVIAKRSFPPSTNAVYVAVSITQTPGATARPNRTKPSSALSPWHASAPIFAARRPTAMPSAWRRSCCCSGESLHEDAGGKAWSSTMLMVWKGI